MNIDPKLLVQPQYVQQALRYLMDQRVRLSRCLAQKKPAFVKRVPDGRAQVIADALLVTLQSALNDEDLYMASLMNMVQEVAERVTTEPNLYDGPQTD